MSNRLDDCRRTALEEQAYAEAGGIFADCLKQFPVSREAVEQLERNLLKLALEAKIAASKPTEDFIQADDGVDWHTGLFWCWRSASARLRLK
jgi:hypothetical protein